MNRLYALQGEEAKEEPHALSFPGDPSSSTGAPERKGSSRPTPTWASHMSLVTLPPSLSGVFPPPADSSAAAGADAGVMHLPEARSSPGRQCHPVAECIQGTYKHRVGGSRLNA